jgi:hypothetical protein
MYRFIITTGSQNGNKINDSKKNLHFFGSTNFLIVGSYTGTSFRTQNKRIIKNGICDVQ